MTGGRTSRHQLFSKFVHIFSDRVSHKSFLSLTRICLKITVKLNSSGLEVSRLNRFGVDGVDLNRLGLITCVDPPLCRGTSQGFQGSRIIGPVCKGETVGEGKRSV